MTGPRGRSPAAAGAGSPTAVFRVRATPRSSRDGIAGLSGGVLRVRLTAPPVENRANEALVALLAGALGLPLRCVVIVAGGKGRTKTVRVEGVSVTEAFRRLGLPGPGPS